MPSAATIESRTPGRRRWFFRGGAILLGLLPIVLAELLCRGLDLGRPAVDTVDPLVEFAAVRPLFELDASGHEYHTASHRLQFFAPDHFATPKPKGEFRIFCLGGSTVQGNPYSIPTSFTTWLELTLQAADPSRTWQAVNVGGVSYASYRLTPIVEEVLRYEPDLILLMVGDNEFLEDRSYAGWSQAPAWTRPLQRTVGQLRLYELIRACCQRPVQRDRLAAETMPRLDYAGGLAKYCRDDRWSAAIHEHYRLNMQRMVRTILDAGTPVLLVHPLYNLRDCPPFKAELAADDQAEFQDHWQQGRTLMKTDPPKGLAVLESAQRLDPRHAGLLYDRAIYALAAGERDAAAQLFLQAKEEDICPLRSTEAMHQIIADLTQEFPTAWRLDPRAEFADRSRHQIPGSDWFCDHVHPTIEGHQLLASLIFDLLTRQGIVHPRQDWQPERDRMFAEHHATLDEHYFLKGEQHLRGLRGWAAGRADQPWPKEVKATP